MQRKIGESSAICAESLPPRPRDFAKVFDARPVAQERWDQVWGGARLEAAMTRAPQTAMAIEALMVSPRRTGIAGPTETVVLADA
jgi:hypothetical protein